MAILEKTDFNGEYKLPSFCYDKLELYIEKFEKEYLIDLLGAELYDLFIADLTPTTPQTPQTQRFIDIFDPFHIDDGSCVRRSEGIKQMLVQFIYFYNVRDSGIKKTAAGVVRDEVEASRELLSGFNMVQSYNEGIKNYHEIQWYICDNPTDYPEENGQFKGVISGI